MSALEEQNEPTQRKDDPNKSEEKPLFLLKKLFLWN